MRPSKPLATSVTLLALIAVTPSSTAETPRRLRLKIRPALATAPGTIRATAYVERHPANRSLTLTAECSDYLRRSTTQLHGAAEAIAHTVDFEHLPVCTYEIRARLRRTDGADIIEVLPAKVTR